MPLTKAERIRFLQAQIQSMESSQPNERPDKADESEIALSQEAFSRIVRLSSVRDRSTSELRKRLREEEFSEVEIDEALQRACSCNLVDDMRYADARIRYLVRDGRGLPGIRRDLANHDINVSDVEGWPHEYLDDSVEGELGRAMSYLERRPSRSKNVLRGSYQKLVLHGYSGDIAMRAANRVACLK